MIGFDEFRKGVEFKVGDGTLVRFWTNIWCEDRSLDSRFPLLFGLAINKDAVVADYLEETGSLIFLERASAAVVVRLGGV